ncbi:MAG: cytochrome d ubiquinol oxidase subunit II [Geminicoccaceae bacterium]
MSDDLICLVFRGVAFEFRWKTKSWKRGWDWSFALGSIGAAFAQGVTLGALVQGIEVQGRAYAGGWWDWLTPFSLATGVSLIVGYALLGATWLILKTDGWVRDRAYQLAWLAGFGILAMIGVVSLWTPFLDPVFMERWFTMPALVYVAPVPLLVLAAAYVLFTGLRKRRDGVPFYAALALFILCFIGLGISLYPHIVPPAITLWDAAAPDTSLAFLLVGAVPLLVLILGYTSWSYWIFRGKVREGEGYH